ncbi:SDR family oxidoreductase [bacterium]|nr:MAG: SDR family oxidoreductase [bacterium]
MELRLRGKCALITGAAQGIGQAVALAFAREGVNVALNDVRADRLDETAARCAAEGVRVAFCAGDVARAADVECFVTQAEEQLGGLDVMVCNAGISERVMLADMSESSWERMIDVNLKGVFLCARAGAVRMARSGGGAIVNLSSIWAKVATSQVAHYAAAKAGVRSLTGSFAYEFGPHNVRVNAVAPGRIATEMVHKVAPEVNETIHRQIPLNDGAFGEPVDVANAVVFLASSAARYITGETLDVNGGWFMD